MAMLRSGLAAAVLAVGLTCVAEESGGRLALSSAGEWMPEHGKLGTADASPVDPGHVETEFGCSWSQARRAWDNDGNRQGSGLVREQAVGLAVTAGVVQDVDVSVGMDYLRLRDDDNGCPTTGDDAGDLCIGGRWRFLSVEPHAFEAAWISGLTVPTGSDGDEHELGTSQEFWTWDNVLVVSKDWGRWTANADAGYSLPFGENRGNARGTLSADLAAGYHVLDWLQPELELNGARDATRDEADGESLAVTAGLIMPLSETVRVNAGVQQGVWGRNGAIATSYMLCIKLAF